MSDGVSLPVRVGDTIAGKYQVERVLGTGSMGVVVAAMHVDLHELRAIKLMLPGPLADAEAVGRFLREARAAARLKSDHVARIHDIGRLETGSPFIVLELLEGTDLEALLERESSVSVERAARYVAQACDAVGEAHTLGIVHRDLKPENLFLTTGPRGEERVKVLDFGIAKITEPDSAVKMTQMSSVFGTPLYMSPEQMRAARNADARSDVWALGVILYSLCTGRAPFLGSTITEVCSAVCTDVPIKPRDLRPEIPPELEAVMLQCLEKEPAARFANANELGAALSAFTGITSTPGRPSGHPATAWTGPTTPRAPLSSAAELPAPIGTSPPRAGSSQPPVPASNAPMGGGTQRAASWAQRLAASSSGPLPPAGLGSRLAAHALAKRSAIAGVGLAVALFGAGGWVTWRSVGAAPTVPAVTATEGMTVIATALSVAPTAEPPTAAPAEPVATATATATPTATATWKAPAAWNWKAPAVSTAAATPAATPSTSAEAATPPATAPRGVAPPLRPNRPTDIRLQR